MVNAATVKYGPRLSRMVPVRFTESRHDELRRLADAEGATVSALIRQATDVLLSDDREGR